MPRLHPCGATLFFAATLLLVVGSAALADEPIQPRYLNLDFETPGHPKGWFVGGQGYRGGLDTEETHSGKQSLHLTYVTAGTFGVGTATFPVDHALEKTVQFTGYIKTRGVEEGYAGLWWRVDGAQQEVLAFDNMTGRGVSGDQDWKKAEIILHVPYTATNINFGVLLTGTGEAWFDDLQIYLSGQLYAQTPPPTVTEPDERTLNSLRQQAYAFAGVEAGHGSTDLSFLDNLVGSARIVALGEVTHGSRDIFQMKHRILEYLVTNLGFRLFAIEASMPEAYVMNRYVLTGTGDPRDLLTGMYFWTWNTQEVLDMVEWMRQFNAGLAPGDEPVQFLGFDMQFPAGAKENIRGFMERYDQSFLPRLDGIFEALDKIYAANQNTEQRFVKDEALLEATWKRLTMHLDAQSDLYASSAESEEVAWLRQNCRVLKQCLDLVVIRKPTLRDESMAENVTWILEQAPADSRIVLWAHNAHVSRQPGAMGAYLEDAFADEMVVFGFTFHEGQYTARTSDDRRLTHVDAFPSELGSIEYFLHRAGVPRLMLDLRPIAKDSPLGPWVHEAVEMRSTGAIETPYGFSDVVAADAYDVLVFLDHTEATVSLRDDFVEPGR